MSWNFMEPESRDNVMEAWDREAAGMFDLVGDGSLWEQPTAAGHWQVRDVIGHMVDTTEAYFRSFDAARGDAEPFEPLGVRDMARHADAGALAFRREAREPLVDRLRADRDEMRRRVDELSDEDWAGLMVTHKYMGPLPACFYPIFQVVDYGVHSWDIRQGVGASHGLDSRTADLLAPLAFVVWQSTAAIPDGTDPYTVGVEITSGENAGGTRVHVAPHGIETEPGDTSDLPAVIEFDPASLVLTAFGRFNGGTVRGDHRPAEHFLDLFFRI